MTYGVLLDNAMQAAELLAKQGVEATVLRMLTVSPLPVAQIVSALSETKHVLILEETGAGAGIREALAWELRREVPDCRIDGIDLGTQYVPHGSLKELYQSRGLDAESIAAYALEVREH